MAKIHKRLLSKKRTRSNRPVIVLRLLVPLTIFIQPFWGAVASIIADDLDVILIDLFHLKKFTNYTLADKLLDLYYLAIECLVVLTWQLPIARVLGVGLFLYRIVGVVVYVIGKNRRVFVVFPGIFDFYFLGLSLWMSVFHKTPTTNNVIVILAVVTPLKMIQEIVLHGLEAKPWEWVKKLGYTLLHAA